MSRSVRKTPKSNYYGCKSERISKLLWHRKMRAMIRQRLHPTDADNLWLPLEREVIDVWCMGKDGKSRFDPVEHPEMLRK